MEGWREDFREISELQVSFVVDMQLVAGAEIQNLLYALDYRDYCWTLEVDKSRADLKISSYMGFEANSRYLKCWSVHTYLHKSLIFRKF